MARAKLMNVEEFHRALGGSDLDAVVAVSLTNVFYTSGALILTQIDIRDRLAFVILTRTGDEILVVCSIEESLARDESWIGNVRSYVEFAQSPVALLAEVLEEKGLAEARIGIEKGYLTEAYFQELAGALPHAQFEGCDDLFAQVRSIKTPGEIQRYQRAAVATEKAIVEALGIVRSDQTERYLFQVLMARLSELGAGDVRMAVVGAGDHSVHAHARARDRTFESGDLVRVRVQAVFDGYLSDVARTAVVGYPTESQRAAHENVMKAQTEMLEWIHPGARACDVYDQCVDFYAGRGVDYTYPSVGRGVGWAGYELPLLRPRNTEVLRPNMLICLDPLVLDGERGGYQRADLALVGDDRARLLTGLESGGDIHVIH